ncbi:MAG: transcription termination factor Rho [Candidatus Eiseniibacteriota bacterium]
MLIAKHARPAGGERDRDGRRSPRASGDTDPRNTVAVGDATGTLEIDDRGHGYLRTSTRMYHPTPDDPVVPAPLIRRYRLREGLVLAGPVGENGRGQRQLLDIETVHGQPPAVLDAMTPLNDLTPINPEERLRFATDGGPLEMRVVDLLTPMGKGQRALIVAPPRTGKTVLLQQMAHGISNNHPEVALKVLLVDERPEEVTDMKRSIRGEVVASSSDMGSDAHVRVAELVLEQARREVELGRDVVIFLDSLTRLGRAYNREAGSSGRTLSGGIDARALERPKRIFGAARNIQDGGSLTIIATALIDTGSRMDEVIFQEFKGTGNMELVLDRTIADHRIWPAIDVRLSGTRKEERLYDTDELERVHALRRHLSAHEPLPAMKELLSYMNDWEGRSASAM